MGEVHHMFEQSPDLPEVRICSHCGEEKLATLEFFAPNGDAGLYSQCRTCQYLLNRERKKNRREKLPEIVRAEGRQYASQWCRRQGMRTQEQRKEEALVATEKICTQCSKTKPVEEFRKNSALRTHTQRSSWCGSCFDAYRRGWAKKYLEEIDWAKRLIIYTRRRSTRWPNEVFDLSVEFLHDLYHKQMGLCFWSGLPMTTDIKSGLRMISVDRIDCSRGYTQDNVRLVTKAMNTARGDATTEEFGEFLDLLVEVER